LSASVVAGSCAMMLVSAESTSTPGAAEGPDACTRRRTYNRGADSRRSHAVPGRRRRPRHLLPRPPSRSIQATSDHLSRQRGFVAGTPPRPDTSVLTRFGVIGPHLRQVERTVDHRVTGSGRLGQIHRVLTAESICSPPGESWPACSASVQQFFTARSDIDPRTASPERRRGSTRANRPPTTRRQRLELHPSPTRLGAVTCGHAQHHESGCRTSPPEAGDTRRSPREVHTSRRICWLLTRTRRCLHRIRPGRSPGWQSPDRRDSRSADPATW
jgi:hypothetical protein